MDKNMFASIETNFLDDLPIGYIYMDIDSTIIYLNKYIRKEMSLKNEELLNRRWKDVFPGLLEGLTDEPGEQKVIHFQFKQTEYIAQRYPFKSGILFMVQKVSDLEKVTKEIHSFKELSMDLKAIFDISYDVIFVADAHGNTIRVSSASKELWGYEEKELLGKNVYQLEREGVFNPSITRMVLERGEKVSSIQKTKTGKRLMVIGAPIKDEEGNIIRVVNASRDITEINKLQKEIEVLKQASEGYKRELDQLREKNDEVQRVVYRSEKMRHIFGLARKLSDVDSTILLLGESGVGKEIISSYIHKSSHRKSNPFISINCGAIPKNLLENELFGYQDTKNPEESRPGLFEIANDGTLFLDEISELPIDSQTKLLRALSEKKIVRIGGKTELDVNVRIIASSNRDLAKEVEEGRFRDDLYYRLNVIPIHIPPLRERKEDILPLTLHFLKVLNQKYKLTKQLSSEVIDQLNHYSWPGNVRELQNIIERMMVTSDTDVIGLNQVPDYIRTAKIMESTIQVSKIIPLKDAVELVEKKLLEMAYEKYGSTTKMAEILNVNQSTISRKMKKNI